MARPLGFPSQPQDPVLDNRVTNVEMRSLTRPQIDQEGDEAGQIIEAVFSHKGTPTTDESGRWYPPRDCALYEVLVSLGVAGSTNTVVEVYVDGGLQGTVTLGSGVHAVVVLFDDALSANTDWLTVAAVTVGTSAEDLTVQARMSVS